MNYAAMLMTAVLLVAGVGQWLRFCGAGRALDKEFRLLKEGRKTVERGKHTAVIPVGVKAGMTFSTQLPDGRAIDALVPAPFGPGIKFDVPEEG